MSSRFLAAAALMLVTTASAWADVEANAMASPEREASQQETVGTGSGAPVVQLGDDTEA